MKRNFQKTKLSGFELQHPLLKIHKKRMFNLKQSKQKHITDRLSSKFHYILSNNAPNSQKLISLRFIPEQVSVNNKTSICDSIIHKRRTLSQKQNTIKVLKQQSQKRILEPKILRKRMFSSDKKKRSLSTDVQQKLPLVYTFGKGCF